MTEAQLAKFEVIEQEKEILEDEYQQTAVTTEDLQIQLNQIKRAKCSRCAQEMKHLAGQSKLKLG